MSRKMLVVILLLFVITAFSPVNADQENGLASLSQQRFELQTARAMRSVAMKTTYIPGQYFYFGTYEQDGDLNNGPEPIEWQILSVDGGKVLLVSRYILDMQPYNESGRDCTWETSTLRKWLNSTFFETAFTSSEREQIAKTKNNNSSSGSYGNLYENDTEDYVFLLSTQQLGWYFSSYPGALKCKASPILQPYTWTGETTMYYWLRTPGRGEYTMEVTYLGALCDWGDPNSVKAGVRPAIWIFQN